MNSDYREVPPTLSASRPTTPIDSVGEALSAALGLTARVNSLVDTLIGAVPEKDGNSHSDSPLGLLPQMQFSANGVIASVARAHDALNRLERMLP